MDLITPTTAQHWQAYYALRFSVLREPWNQPLGSEVLQDEASAIHAMAVDEDEKVLGVARMHESSPKQGQVRCVAVATGQQGKGIGKLIMRHLEKLAAEKGWQEIVLEARENAVPFYESLGYSIIEKSYLLFDEIQHYRMKKALPLSE
jgi:N-acetylglutamate synthase-like GNAT family acetyltransferase